MNDTSKIFPWNDNVATGILLIDTVARFGGDEFVVLLIRA